MLLCCPFWERYQPMAGIFPKKGSIVPGLLRHSRFNAPSVARAPSPQPLSGWGKRCFNILLYIEAALPLLRGSGYSLLRLHPSPLLSGPGKGFFVVFLLGLIFSRKKKKKKQYLIEDHR